MHKAGRASWIVVAMAVVVVVIGVFILFSGEQPTGAGQAFLEALARADAEKLADMSYFDPPLSREEAVKAWKQTLEVGRYYQFAWRITGDSRPSPTEAKVKMMFVKNADSEMSYEENFSLDLVRVGGSWKVDVRSLSRELYPALPR